MRIMGRAVLTETSTQRSSDDSWTGKDLAEGNRMAWSDDAWVGLGSGPDAVWAFFLFMPLAAR